MLFLFKSTPENKKRKHSEHFFRSKGPGGSQRASRTYDQEQSQACTRVTKVMMMSGMKMRIVGGRPRAGPGVHVRRILSDPTSEQLRVP